MEILLIDQDLSTLEKLQYSLARAGHHISIAADRDAGIRLAREKQPDVIVLDILLTGLEGVDLTQQLKQDEETKSIPIILVTALNVPARNEPWKPAPQAKWQLLRYHDYLPKPIDVNHLVRKIEALANPDKPAEGPTGPSVILVTEDVLQQNQLKEALVNADFNVSSYEDISLALPAVYTYIPTCLVVDADQLHGESVWAPLQRFQERHPSFSLMALVKNPSEMPLENEELIDRIINAPIQPWHIVRAVKKSLEHRNLQARVKILSEQVLGLNGDLSHTKQTLQYQNEELDHINRQLRDLSEIKETLTGMLVHDLKAPLSAMMGAMQFLTMDPNNTVSENSRRILTGGLAAGQQMLRMTHTLLDEQKLEDNQLVFDIEPVEIEDPLETSLEMLSPLFSMYKVRVEKQIEENLPPIKADPIILQRIIENLLDNAIKYSPTDEVITIRALRDNDFAEICIADRGDGIPPEHRDRIFDRFVQLQDGKPEKTRGGVGLGLAFCKLAVSSMGGNIWVDSLNDVGTAFFFTLPLALDE